MTAASGRIRVGIIGQGRSGHDIHAHAIVKHVPDKFTVVAVADPRPGQLQSDLLGPDVARLNDYRALFARDDIDLIVNASPSHLHVPITLEALKAGFDVLCEKPFARRAAEVDRMAAAAKKAGRFLAVFQQSRFSPAFRKVREIIRSGVLGRIALVKISYNGFGRRWDWQTLQENNAGSLLNTGPHPVDQALQLFGTDAMPTVHAVLDRATTFGDAEDVVKLILSGRGRPTIDVEICSCAAYSPYTYVVNGSQGSLAGTLEHLDWKYFDPATAPKQAVTLEPLPGRTWCTEQLSWKEERWDYTGDGLSVFETISRDYYLDLHASYVDRSRPMEVKVAEVRQQIAVMEEAHRQSPLKRGTNAGR